MHIFIYIYMCVCVCVVLLKKCTTFSRSSWIIRRSYQDFNGTCHRRVQTSRKLVSPFYQTVSKHVYQCNTSFHVVNILTMLICQIVVMVVLLYSLDQKLSWTFNIDEMMIFQTTRSINTEAKSRHPWSLWQHYD